MCDLLMDDVVGKTAMETIQCIQSRTRLPTLRRVAFHADWRGRGDSGTSGARRLPVQWW